VWGVLLFVGSLCVWREEQVRDHVLKNQFSSGAFSMFYVVLFDRSLEPYQQTRCCFCHSSSFILYVRYMWPEIFTALETQWE